MRADRLLSILLLLQVNRRMTARELAGRLEVSQRTIYRDMEALSAAGVPVYAERGPAGGWVLPEAYRTDLTGLGEAEIRALFLARPPRLLADLGLGTAADGALVKLLAALPAAQRRDAEYARQRIHIDVTGWNHAEEAVPLLHVLQDAIWQERRLRIVYERGGCDAVERLVDPLGLVAKGSVWYFVAAVEGEVRSYRVSRVRAARLSEEEASRPEGFDLAAFWAGSVARLKREVPRFDATFRTHGSVLHLLHYAGRFSRVEEVGEPDADGWAAVRMRFQFEEDACAVALGLGAKVEPVEPRHLREKVLQMAREVVDLYSRR